MLKRKHRGASRSGVARGALDEYLHATKTFWNLPSEDKHATYEQLVPEMSVSEADFIYDKYSFCVRNGVK